VRLLCGSENLEVRRPSLPFVMRNKGSPSLIVTPKCFKLLLQNGFSAQVDEVGNVEVGRDGQQVRLAKHVCPGGQESGLVAHDDFCLMLGICILRAEETRFVKVLCRRGGRYLRFGRTKLLLPKRKIPGGLAAVVQN
jgi:hypothetical protein